MDRCRPHTFVFQLLISVQIVWGLDEVILLNRPAEPVSGYVLKVLYSCDHPSVVQLDCVVSFDTGDSSTIPLRHWSCVPGNPKVKRLTLALPDWLVYQADGIVPDSGWVLSVMLRASLGGDGSDDGDRSAAPVRDVVALHPTPPLRRPLKPHRLCHSWSTLMLWLTHRASRTRCPLEHETVYLLSSVYASTGENFGITKTLHAYSSDVLEHLRLKAVTFPWCVFSAWLFLLKHCQQNMCGVFYHIDLSDNYVTPAVMLTRSGQLHVQMNGEPGESSAFLCPFTVPLKQWCHLAVALRGRTVALTMVCVDGGRRTASTAEYTFRHAIVLDDTDGYFGIGGGTFVKGVEGYYGPLEYNRNAIPPHSTSEVVLPEFIKNVNLTGWIQTCDDFRLELFVKIRGYSLKARQNAESERCADAYHSWLLKDKLQLHSQCEPWEATLPQRRHAAELAKILALKHGGREVNLTSVGRALYSLSLRKLGKVSHVGAVGRTIALLLQAGCLGDNRALHLSSVLFSSGLGTKRRPDKAWLLALLAAQEDWRLALLRLGHLHHRGDHGIPSDTDLAFAYYANIAKQTAEDRQNPSPQQKFVESIYLNDEEMLKLQTTENDDLFHWLKHQAGRGAADAEQTVARMLFWGQQGVSPDIEKAVRHYERGAVRLEDPVSMYNYAIVLLQGHGVKKDIPKAVAFLKRAAKQGCAPAMNALGWYYEQFERDYERAVQLWEQADLHGSPDAAMNLGVMYSQGLYPGKPADQFVAYTYYLKSAERGHVTGAIHVAEVWTTGMPGRVERRPSDAVLWMKWAAEHNGYLGDVLRKALDSYFKSDMLMSLLYYMMAAEAGYEAAQFNVAYMCEQNTGRFLDPAFAAHCMRRYYSLSAQSPNPASYALIRMGDLLYEEGLEGGPADATAAAGMYTLAAVRSEPQGWYNLGLLVQDGYKLPMSLLTELGLQELYLADNITLLTTLYGRCRDTNGTESYLPCSLALFNAYLQAFQKDYSATIKLSSAVVMVLAAPPALFIILGVVLRRCGLSRHWAQ